MKKNSGNHGMTIEKLAGITQKGFEDLEFRMDKRFDRVDKRFEFMEERLNKVEDKLDDIEWQLASKADKQEFLEFKKQTEKQNRFFERKLSHK